MKISVIGNSPAYEAMFQREGWEVVKDYQDADIVQFTGGEDVTPGIYGDFPHPRTYNSEDRDQYEMGVYKELVGNKPMLGICRGAQFLNVMNKGKLYQDVDGHAIGTTHPCVSTVLGQTIEVTSTHHQMMIPAVNGVVEGWAYNLARRKERMPEKGVIATDINNPIDVEVVWYEDTKCLCFQPHPEFAGADSTRYYYFTLIQHFLPSE